MLDVREGCAWVLRHAGSVRIDAGALDALAHDLRAAPAPTPWGPPHLTTSDAPAATVAAWTLLLSALNFCFWEDEPRWRVEGRDGYMALAHALRRAHDAGVPVADAGHIASWSVDQLALVLQGDAGGPDHPPLLAERHAICVEMGRWLVDRHGGDALAPLTEATSAYDLAVTLATELRGFRDVAEYRGRRVPLLKRAQIAAHDAAAGLGARAPEGLRHRAGLTAFADYKLPQVLRHAGGLRYAPPLARAVDGRIPLPPGSEEEVEIRAATVVAVDLLVERLAAAGTDADAAAVDSMLWWRGQSLAGAAPYHRTRTIWY